MLESVSVIFGILAPAVLLALIGLVWVVRGGHYPVPFVTTLVINIGLPALLFHTLATSTVQLASLGRLALAAIAVHVLSTSVSVTLLKLSGKDWRLAVAHVVGNTGNLGLPLCLLAFGDEGLAYAMAYFALQCLLMFSLGDAIYAGRFTWRAIFQSPVLAAVVAGIVVRLMNVPLPQIVLDTTSLLSGLVIPIMLITLGVSLASLKVRQLSSCLFWSVVRTGVAVCVAYFVAEVFQLEGIARGVLIIEATVPVAVFNFLLAQKHGRDSAEVSGLILVTHLGSLLYLPFILHSVLL